MLSVPFGALRDRLVNRWLDHGQQPADAVARAEGNGIVNARTVIEHSARADLIGERAGVPGKQTSNGSGARVRATQLPVRVSDHSPTVTQRSMKKLSGRCTRSMPSRAPQTSGSV